VNDTDTCIHSRGQQQTEIHENGNADTKERSQGYELREDEHRSFFRLVSLSIELFGKSSVFPIKRGKKDQE
jgi:hypothetical protein